MITDNQQKIIDSIIAEFEAHNQESQSKSFNALYDQVMAQMGDHKKAVDNLRINTMAYDKVNEEMFDEFSAEIVELCEMLELDVDVRKNQNIGKLFMSLCYIVITFPNFYDGSTAGGKVRIEIKVEPNSTLRVGKIDGLSDTGLTYSFGYGTIKTNNKSEFLPLVVKKIVDTKKYWEKY